MSGLEGLLAIALVSLMPVALVFITRYYAFRERELMVREGAEARRLVQLGDEQRRLEGRLENLESIVCNADFELDARLRELTARDLGTPPARLSDNIQDPGSVRATTHRSHHLSHRPTRALLARPPGDRRARPRRSGHRRV